jgi:hypothetical protein
MKYQVLKKFNSDRPLEIGEEVELDGPHIEKLVEQRYLQPLELLAPLPKVKKAPVAKKPAEVKAAVPAPEKRGRGRPKGSKTRARAVTVPTTTPEPETAPEAE